MWHTCSYLDESIGWGMAVLGVYVQLSHNFGLPFPLNLLLVPVRMGEYIVLYFVTR